MIEGAVKYDQGKPPVFRGSVAYFPEAISLVSSVSNFGATKYAWEGWRFVDDGFNRYSDAMVRHLLQEGQADFLDPDSGLPHIAHTTWNSLARLELWIAAQKSSS